MLVGLCGEQVVEAGEDRLECCHVGEVDLGEALVAVGLCALGELLCARALLEKDRPEGLVGHERIAGQARVGVWALLLDGNAAVAVGQRLLRAREALLQQRRVGRNPRGQDLDPLAAAVDAIEKAVQLAAQRVVLQLCVVRGHLRRGMAVVVLHGVLGHPLVDHLRAEGVAQTVRPEVQLLTVARFQAAPLDPLDQRVVNGAHVRRAVAGRVAVARGEQPGRLLRGPEEAHPLLLGADDLSEVR